MIHVLKEGKKEGLVLVEGSDESQNAEQSWNCTCEVQASPWGYWPDVCAVGPRQSNQSPCEGFPPHEIILQQRYLCARG